MSCIQNSKCSQFLWYFSWFLDLSNKYNTPKHQVQNCFVLKGNPDRSIEEEKDGSGSQGFKVSQDLCNSSLGLLQSATICMQPFLTHAILLDQVCAHCPRFPHCCPSWKSGPRRYTSRLSLGKRRVRAGLGNYLQKQNHHSF